MASNYWAKLWIEILDDSKVGRLSDNLWRRFVECILLAKEIDDDGRIPSISDIAWRLRLDEESLRAEFEQLARVGLLDYISSDPLDRHWIVTNYTKRQGPQTVAERVSRHRKAQKKRIYNGLDNANVTNRYTEEEEETESEEEEEVKSAATSPTFAQESIQERDARRLLESICGVLTTRALEHFGTVEDMISAYGLEPTREAIKRARQDWVSTPRKNGNGNYSPTNYGFIDWALAALQGGEIQELDPYDKIIRDLGGIKK